MSDTDYIVEAKELIGWQDEPRQIVTEISGFYPIFEAVIREVDLEAASIHGVMWRFCQMQDGVCKASLDTIASILGLSRATVMRRQDELERLGYFRDLSPELRNRPHVWADTGKVALRSSLTAGVSGRNTSVSGRNSGVAGRNVTVSHSNMNKDSNKDSNKVVEEAGSPQPKFAQVTQAPASAAAFSDAMVNAGAIDITRRAQMVLLRASRLAAIPGGSLGYIDTVASMIESHGEDATADALVKAREAWIARPKKNGGGTYSPLNFAWVDWAMAELSGQSALPRPKQEVDKFAALNRYLQEQEVGQ